MFFFVCGFLELSVKSMYRTIFAASSLRSVSLSCRLPCDPKGSCEPAISCEPPGICEPVAASSLLSTACLRRDDGSPQSTCQDFGESCRGSRVRTSCKEAPDSKNLFCPASQQEVRNKPERAKSKAGPFSDWAGIPDRG